MTSRDEDDDGPSVPASGSVQKRTTFVGGAVAAARVISGTSGAVAGGLNGGKES
jgi:hypothetical protein